MKRYKFTNAVIKNEALKTEADVKEFLITKIEDGFKIDIESDVEMHVSDIIIEIEDELAETQERKSNGKLVKKRQGIRKAKLNKRNRYSHLDDDEIVKDNYSYKKTRKHKYTGEIDKETVKSLDKNFHIKTKKSV